EVRGQWEGLLPVLGCEDARPGGAAADERDVAHGPALDRRARAGLEAHLDGARLRRVADEVALVLQGGEVGVDRRARRQADGLADLPDARGVAAAPHLGRATLDHLARLGGQ